MPATDALIFNRWKELLRQFEHLPRFQNRTSRKHKIGALLNTKRNAFFGGIAPAAITLNAIHGFLTSFINSAVSLGLRTSIPDIPHRDL
jgi:hypothetical protein